MPASNGHPIAIMPYSMVVGQKQLKLALELAYVAPRIGGVLLSGQRGTGKSTLVRAFAHAVYGDLPVTLPINATEDRVVGGWNIGALLNSQLQEQPGLLESADGKLLYIDEVNLLDDHIVNMILDVTSTGVLSIEREGRHTEREVRFTLVGTMNPSEGGLRPQLLDRFGVMVDVVSETDDVVREDILRAVLDYDAARALERTTPEAELAPPPLQTLRDARASDSRRGSELQAARDRLGNVKLPAEMAKACVQIGKRFQVEGHRGDYIMALAARARAAIRGVETVEADDVREVAPLALQHRRPGVLQSGKALWSAKDADDVRGVLGIPAAEQIPAS